MWNRAPLPCCMPPPPAATLAGVPGELNWACEVRGLSSIPTPAQARQRRQPLLLLPLSGGPAGAGGEGCGGLEPALQAWSSSPQYPSWDSWGAGIQGKGPVPPLCSSSGPGKSATLCCSLLPSSPLKSPHLNEKLAFEGTQVP